MTLEAILAYLHFLAILMVVVFISSEAALCRVEWMNKAVIERLVRVDALYGVSAALVLASGVARTWWGIKGTAWYWAQPLLHLKLTLFVLIGILSIFSTRRYFRWRQAVRATGALPMSEEIGRTRRLVMIQAHLLVLVPLAAVFLARGWGG